MSTGDAWWRTFVIVFLAMLVYELRSLHAEVVATALRFEYADIRHEQKRLDADIAAFALEVQEGGCECRRPEGTW